MSSDNLDDLKSLHTILVDSRAGYEQALADAKGEGMAPLFAKMIAMRTTHIEVLGRALTALGAVADEKGSFMSTVNRAVINFRALFGGLDESVLPGLIDGEERISTYYDEALSSSQPDSAEHGVLVSQQSVLRSVIAEMRQRYDLAA